MSTSSVIIKVQIQPRSSKNEIAGLHNGRLKIKISAPPVDGKANQALIEFIAKVLGVSKSKVEIVKEHTSKLKTLKVSGITQEFYRSFLEKYKDS